MCSTSHHIKNPYIPKMPFHNGVDSSTQELLDAQTHIWNHIFNFIKSMSLKCAIELGIPDVIHKHGKPMTLSELADALAINGAKSDGLHRLMRTLVHSKFFDKVKISEDGDEEAYRLTWASRLLLRDEPMNAIPMALVVLDPITIAPLHHLSRWFQNDDSTPFVTAHGKAFWEHAVADQRYNKLFNEGMASDSRIVNNVLVKECKQVFEGLESMVDVGGGTGETGKCVVRAFPGLRCIVLDLPHVVDGLEGSENLSFVGGDMFESIPHADAVFLKWILHDWDDEACIKILKKCKDAIGSKGKGGKVMIIDMVVGINEQGDNTIMEDQLFFDMIMMTLVCGKERNEREWEKLFSKSGFSSYKITPAFGVRSLIEVYPN